MSQTDLTPCMLLNGSSTGALSNPALQSTKSNQAVRTKSPKFCGGNDVHSKRMKPMLAILIIVTDTK